MRRGEMAFYGGGFEVIDRIFREDSEGRGSERF